VAVRLAGAGSERMEGFVAAKWARWGMAGIAGMATVGVVLSAIAWILPQWWVGELLGHLRIHLGMGLLIAAGMLAWRWRWWGLPFFAVAMLNLALLIPFYGANQAQGVLIRNSLKIVHYNLDQTARDHGAAFAYLRGQQADILFLQEVTPALADQFARELPAYRLVYARPLQNTHGSALLLPIDSTLVVDSVGEVFLPASSPRPMITALIWQNDRPLLLLSMAVIRPKDGYSNDIQEQEFAAIGSWLRVQHQQTGYPILVIGDFNSTPWSERFQRLLANSGMRDSSIGFGYQPTWPAVASVAGIPIDHSLVSPEIIVLGRGTGPDLGGDHSPLWLRLSLSKQRLATLK
jgi:endonuclease/exonuclease/phosphatase (EEP) superfamily protein YafD